MIAVVKTILFTTTIVFCANSISFAQTDEKEKPTPRFDLKISAGSTLTFVSGFDNWTVVARMELLYPMYTRSKILKPHQLFLNQSVFQPRLGWYVDAQVAYRLPNDFGLMLAVGAKENSLRHGDYILQYRLSFLSISRNLDDINPAFGETALTYFSVAPSISRSYMRNRITVEIGPTFNFLLKEKINNVLLTYDNAVKPIQVFRIRFILITWLRQKV